MALTSDQITALNFKDFYGQIRPYLNGTAHGGFTPIGTVISVMGNHAPLNYLICDGTVYNITDYSELASYFNQEFGSINFFGGNGTTTFAVPDLRGEFLRGTGTNSHAHGGTGLAVGVHQQATLYPYIGINTQQTKTVWTNSTGTSDESGNGIYPLNIDTQIIGYGGNNKGMDKPNGLDGTWAGATNVTNYTGRPTNTSVLYCIATKNIFMDAGCNYSTDEQVVGTWVDGKPIYQKTFASVLPTATTMGSIIYSYIDIGAQVETVVDQKGKFHTLSNGLWHDTIFDMDINSGWNYAVKSLVYDNSAPNNANKILIGNADTAWNDAPLHITIQYTKTTD